MKLYGIPNCTTVKKARAWLDERAVPYTFVDFKKSPPSSEQVRHWSRAVGWEALLNRRGTTWRLLGPEVQASVIDEPSAVEVMRRNPSVIKRPVVEVGEQILVGFDERAYASHTTPNAGGRR